MEKAENTGDGLSDGQRGFDDPLSDLMQNSRAWDVRKYMNDDDDIK